MNASAVKLREVLDLPKPSALLLLIGKVWPLSEAVAWRAREKMLDELASEFKRLPQPLGAHTIMWAMDKAGRSHPLLLEEMHLRVWRVR